MSSKEPPRGLVGRAVAGTNNAAVKSVVAASDTQVADAEVVRFPPPAPRELIRLDTVEELSAFPDGTVVIWHSPDGRDFERQAGVLHTWDEIREIRPISVVPYESDFPLDLVDPPVWVVTFEGDSLAAEDR